mmetsp:Transcript_22979/g.52676  ORF Transcript_22979/g.52676 Transcript_22979/m.52676 type:complete len:285 (+) Transcript_22979:378-1232(+)
MVLPLSPMHMVEKQAMIRAARRLKALESRGGCGKVQKAAARRRLAWPMLASSPACKEKRGRHFKRMMRIPMKLREGKGLGVSEVRASWLAPTAKISDRVQSLPLQCHLLTARLCCQQLEHGRSLKDEERRENPRTRIRLQLSDSLHKVTPLVLQRRVLIRGEHSLRSPSAARQVHKQYLLRLFKVMGWHLQALVGLHRGVSQLGRLPQTASLRALQAVQCLTTAFMAPVPLPAPVPGRPCSRRLCACQAGSHCQRKRCPGSLNLQALKPCSRILPHQAARQSTI